MLSIKPENYTRLFHVHGGKFNQFFLEIFQRLYKNLDNLVISQGGDWTNYLPTKIIEKTKKDGFAFFSNNQAFQDYKKNFENYFDRCREIPKILRKSKLSLKDFEELIALLGEFFVYYSKTEFFYTDLAFAKLADVSGSKKKTLEANLKEIGRIKWNGRKRLNKFFLEDKSYVATLVKKLGQQFDCQEKSIVTATHDEIRGLFHGKKLNQRSVKERTRSLFIAAINKKNVVLSKGERQRAILAFQHHFQGSVKELRGISANPGIARGRAAVLELNIENFKRYLEEAHRIKAGSILIAETTSPEIVFVCKISKAIVTNQGGLLSHAAIISLELKIPCVVGTGNATQIIKTGDLIEVDANKGIVRILK